MRKFRFGDKQLNLVANISFSEKSYEIRFRKSADFERFCTDSVAVKNLAPKLERTFI